MRIACISDTHGLWLPPIPDNVDAVFHAGDIGPDRVRASANWLRGPFSEWAAQVGKPIYATWGNHDFIGQMRSQVEALVGDVAVHFLADEAVCLDDDNGNPIKVWFSPWSNLFGHWAFMEIESELKRRYARIPDDTQIIVSHGPPNGYGDRILGEGYYQNVGSTSLLERFVELPDCSTLVCGHIHEAAGTYLLPNLPKQVVNCAQVDLEYQPRHAAVHILDIRTAPQNSMVSALEGDQYGAD